jgi:hypothetical protein
MSGHPGGQSCLVAMYHYVRDVEKTPFPAIRALPPALFERQLDWLQARYRLIEPTGTGHYRCDSEPDHDVVATYFPTDPPTAIAERGDDIAVLYAQPAASGARYVGRSESIWEHQGEAMIAWRPGNPERRCVVVR